MKQFTLFQFVLGCVLGGIIMTSVQAEPSKLITSTLSTGNYLARPDDTKPHPGIVMIHEWWGLNDNIKAQADTLAKEGYIVLAVDLYHGKVTKDPAEAGKLTQSTDKKQAVTDLMDAVSYLKSQSFVNKDKIGSIGWCFGGGYSLQLAIKSNDLKACVLYYGRLVNDTNELGKIKAPILGIFGSADKSISVESVNEFDSLLTTLQKTHDIKIYPDVGHAFANPSNPGFHPEFTKDAWSKVLAFYKKNL
jgi:carboxymethylenebutenolidase